MLGVGVEVLLIFNHLGSFNFDILNEAIKYILKRVQDDKECELVDFISILFKGGLLWLFIKIDFGDSYCFLYLSFQFYLLMHRIKDICL